MTKLKVLATVGTIAVITSLAPSAIADEWNRKTAVTFTAPVEIPGVHLAGLGVLPAGTYIFKIVDSPSNRNIVQISSEDETTVYATILAIPNYRLKATDKTVITFSERPAGQPEALRAWFYPGRNWGEEFVYPKTKAADLAKASNAPVLFTAEDVAFEVADPAKVTDELMMLELKRTPIMAINPSGQEIQLTQAVTPPPALPEVSAAAQPEQQVAPRRLPDTASSLPLVGLIGLAALGVAVVIRASSKRV